MTMKGSNGAIILDESSYFNTGVGSNVDDDHSNTGLGIQCAKGCTKQQLDGTNHSPNTQSASKHRSTQRNHSGRRRAKVDADEVGEMPYSLHKGREEVVSVPRVLSWVDIEFGPCYWNTQKVFGGIVPLGSEMAAGGLIPGDLATILRISIFNEPSFDVIGGLDEMLEKVKTTISQVSPIEKRLFALEEADYEAEGGEEGTLEKEMSAQSMQTLCVYRPRVVIHGPVTIGGDPTGLVVILRFRNISPHCYMQTVEAKRHQPSVVYIPSLVDPTLFPVVVDGKFLSLLKYLKFWFRLTKNNRIIITSPTEDLRKAFLKGWW
ncbi:hypothetical protein AMATHDRAFT_9534 [Amanita thiersii Skay4041]|uniref:Uncharacterized protein n=1 Tax=Amanita thiersii Skay4041 TaxID=703135 RepID=A0A2A9N6J2_9AGAR|nr:hypothetical protein AMATHDRAFT_9534 [Amanita thiersii Skay4041]